MKSSELYDVIPDSWATPIAAQKPLEEAYQIDVSLRVISRIQDELIDPSVSKAIHSNKRRNNPARDAQSAADTICSLLKVEEVPKTLKLASKLVSKIASGREIGRVNQELATAYAQLKESLTYDFAVSVATSYANLAQAQGSQVNIGVVAQIIAARWGYFSDTITLENSGSFSFEILNPRQQDFIEVLIFGTYSLVDLNDEDISTALNVDAYCIALSTFPNDKVLYELFSRLAGESTEIEDFALAESRPQSYAKSNPNHIGPHYATPYIYALAIASKLNSNISSWTRSSKAFVADPYTFVQGNILDSKGLKQICANAQTNNFTEALIKIATATLIDKDDSARVLKSPSLKTLLDARGLLRKEGDTVVSGSVELIAGLAMAVGSDTDVANEIYASNLGPLTAQKILSNITQKLGQPVEALPSVAYEYATASNIGGRTYFEWAFDLLQAYTEIRMKGFSSNSAKFAVEGVRRLAKDLNLRQNEIPKLLKCLANFKASGLLADSKLNHPANPQSDENAVDWNSLHSWSGDRQIAIASSIIQAVESAGCSEIFNLVFQENTVDIANPLQCIVLAAAFYVDNDKPNAKHLAFEKLPTTVSMNEIYVSTLGNPLTLFMGQETFYNCCLTSYREATSAVCASFFTKKQYKVVGGFEFGAENKLDDPIACTALTTLVWSEVTGSNVYVDQRSQASIAFEPTEIALKICSPNLTNVSQAFTNDPNATVKGWFVGGGEYTNKELVGLSDGVIEKATYDLVSAILNPSTKFGKDLLGGNCHGMNNPHMKTQSERIGLSLTESFFSGEANEDKFNNSNIANAKKLCEAYDEATRGTVVFCSTVLGQQKVSVASSNFKSLDVYFEDLADDMITCIYTDKSGQKLTLDLEHQNNTSAGDILRYMFSFPKGETFIPFEGSVNFHTSKSNQDVCEKLLIPDWFFGKPLRIHDITYTSDDLVEMRTPKKGVFLIDEDTSKKSRLL